MSGTSVTQGSGLELEGNAATLFRVPVCSPRSSPFFEFKRSYLAPPPHNTTTTRFGSRGGVPQFIVTLTRGVLHLIHPYIRTVIMTRGASSYRAVLPNPSSCFITHVRTTASERAKL